MNKSKFYNAIHEFKEKTRPNSQWYTVLNLPSTDCSEQSYIFLAFPALKYVDATLSLMMEHAMEIYQKTHDSVKCLIFVEDDDYIFYSMKIMDGNHREVFESGKVTISIYNTSISQMCIDQAAKEGCIITNLDLFMYAYHIGIDEKLCQIATNEQMQFLQRDWTNLIDNSRLLRDFVQFLLQNHHVYH